MFLHFDSANWKEFLLDYIYFSVYLLARAEKICLYFKITLLNGKKFFWFAKISKEEADI